MIYLPFNELFYLIEGKGLSIYAVIIAIFLTTLMIKKLSLGVFCRNVTRISNTDTVEESNITTKELCRTSTSSSSEE